MKAKYYSLVGRRGKKRALVAVGHKLLIMSYHILKHKMAYEELGETYLDRRRKDKIARSYIKRLAALGLQVTIKEMAA